MHSIQEHHQITCLHVDNNRLMSKGLFVIYFVATPFLDVLLYLCIFAKLHLALYTFFLIATIISIFFVFLVSLNTALLCQSAHESYEAINSFYVSQENSKNPLSIKKKLKIVNFLERLSGPKIAVYVLDLFPLNYYQFSLFIASISCNFLLTVNIFEKLKN